MLYSETVDYFDECIEVATRGVLQKKLFLKFCTIRRKTPVFESLFNKVAYLQACLKRDPSTGVFL